MVDADDEFMHDPGPHRDWQESFFFSWFDARSDAMGLARIGYRPSDHTADALLYTMRNGGVEGGYARLNTRYTGTPDPSRLSVGALEFHMCEPMSKWRLLLRGRDAVDLTWTALHAPYDFRAEAPPDRDGRLRVRRRRHRGCAGCCRDVAEIRVPGSSQG